MQFFINIIDLSKMDDMNFTYEPGGHFVYRAPIAGVAFKISQRLRGLEARRSGNDAGTASTA